MAFDDVYNLLLDIFPQVDSRALRAVAIEHSEAFDVAILAVLDDVAPLVSEKSEKAWMRAFLKDETDNSLPLSPFNSIDGYDVNRGHGQSFHDFDDNGRNEPFYDAYDGNQEGERSATCLKLSEKTHSDGINLRGDVYCEGESVGYIDKNREVLLPREASVDPKRMETIPGDKFPESNIKMSFGTGENQENDQEMSSIDGKSHLYGTLTTFHDVTLSPLEVNLSSDTVSKAETMSNIVGTKDESTQNATMSQSNQQHTHVLDKVIEDARYNKKILFSKLESIINLMRQVELKEQAAELAKEEAVTVCLAALKKVEELEGRVEHANKANQMHAGEVQSEKVILATESRELCACLLSQLDERNKSLGVLDEMRQTLQLRLAAAENEIEAVKKQKLDAEMAGRILLATQESLMEKVVEESKILRQQTEENTKLQEFLVDRGLVVDILQGEIAVICQDVRLLKEKLDETGSVSKALSFRQNSFIEASFDSSSESLIPDQMESMPVGDDSLETQNETDHEEVSGEEASADDCKALQDDGWDLIKDREIKA